MPIPPDSTIASVHKAGLLEDPEGYVRGVLENMGPCRRRHGAAYARIGVEGDGKAPNYQIEHEQHAGVPPPASIFGAFRGRGHKPLVENEALQRHTWSTDAMPFDQVQSLLGEIRNFPKRSP